MFNSIRSRAIGLVSTQAIRSGAELFRRGLGVLMLLVTASVMLNLATPGAARADPASVSFTASLSDTSIQAGETTTLTFEITNAGPAFQAFLGIGTGSFATTAYALPAGVVVGASGVTSNTCSLDFVPGQTATAGATSFRISDFLVLPATCTVSIQITAASAGTYNFDNAVSYVGDVGGTDVVGTITIPGPLTVTAAPDPTPTLSFATPTSASVAHGGALTNAATSTITGGAAGAITYSSSNTNVATVNSTTGRITTVVVGTATITATQAAAEGVNAEATQTYALTVTVGAGSTSSATLSASTVAVGDTIDLTITVSNYSGVDVVAGDGAGLAAGLVSGFVSYGSGPLSNDCGGSQTYDSNSMKAQSGLAVANGATCTIVYRLTATGASATLEYIFVNIGGGTSNLNGANYVLPLTVTPPVPVLTFATPTMATPPSASVVHGGSLTVAATSTISGGGAGAITYSSSDTNVATVNAATGAITTVSASTTTITATQAASSVNATATQTYALTVTVGAGSTSSATLSASTVVVGDTVDLTITVTNNSGGVVYGAHDASLTASLANGWVSYGLGGAISNSCGGSLTGSSVNEKVLTGIELANGATCTVVYRLTATSASATPESISVILSKGIDSPLNSATYALPLTVTPPVPVLTFPIPTSASVAMGVTLFNVANSTITDEGAGAITYESDDTDIATVDATTGAVTPVSTGTTTITATQAAAEGVNAEGSQYYELTVTAPALAIEGRSLPAWTVDGEDYSETIVATGGAAPLTYVVNDRALPGGLTLDATTGEIEGQPTEAGDFGFSVQVTDGLGRTAQNKFQLTINPAITVAPETIEGGLVGQAYSQTFEASGGTGPLRFGFKGDLPTGVTFNPETAVLSGTPTEAGIFEFSVTASDRTDGYGRQHYSLVIEAPAPVLTFATPDSASVAMGGSLTNPATSTINDEGAGAITYESDDTDIATVDENTGVVTPVSAGTANITATQAAAEGVNAEGSQYYELTVTAPALAIQGRSLPAWTVDGEDYAETIVAKGRAAPLTYVVNDGALPGGLTLDATTGVISGTPTVADDFRFSVRVTDGLGRTAEDRFQLIINPAITVGPATIEGGVVGQAYSQTFEASGGTGALGFAFKGDLPTGVTFNPETAVLSGTPTEAGTFTFSVIAVDSTRSNRGQRYRLVIEAPAPVPVLTFATPTTASVAHGGALTNAATSTITGGDAGAITYSSSNTGVATVDASTGAITTVATGTATITATQAAAAGVNATGSQTYQLTVSAPTPPAITTTTLASWTVLQPGYSDTLVATGTGPLTFTVAEGYFPNGLTLNPSTGAITGTPVSAGHYIFTVSVTDGVGQADSRTLAITINSIVYVNPGDLPNGVRSTPYSQAIEGLGGTGSLALTLGGGSLPPGLALNSETGLLVGTPTATGTYSFTLTATDSVGAAGSRAYTLIIEAGQPVVGPVSLTVAQNSIDNPVALVLSGGAATSVSVTTGPAHGSVTVAGTTITYTPTAGYYGPDSFAYTASSDAGTSEPATVGLTVNAPTLAITPQALPSAEQSIAYSQSLSAGGGAAPYSFTVVDGVLPPGLSLSSAGLISGAPTGQGTYAFTVRAQDSSTGSGPAATTRDYSLTVAVAPPPVAAAVQVSVTIDATDDTNAGMTAIDLSTSVSSATGIIIVTMPLHGAVKISGFVVTYTPDAGYYGSDSFTYRAVGLPGSGGSGSGSGGLAAAAMPGSPLYCYTSGPGMSAPAMVSITVLPPTLTMSPSATPSATVGSAFSQQFTADGGTAPYNDFRVEAGALPAGLTLSSMGLLTGTPTAGGTFGFTIAATDSSTGAGPFDASREYSLTVSAPTLSLSPGVLSDGLQGASYSPVTFAGQGGTAPYSYSLASGSLPTGMTLSSAGLLSGTPIQSGHFSFTVRTTDASTGGGPFSSDQAVTLDIGVPAAPTASAGTLASPYNSAGVEIDVAALVSGAYGSVALTTDPAHGSVVRSGTRFTYTPTAGYYGPDSFSYTAVGFGGPSTPAVVSVTVATPAPVTTPKSATTPANASVDVAVTTGDSGPIASIAISQPPSHGEAVVSGLSVTYTPATNYFGADSFSYTATGAGGTSAPAVVSLTVSPLPVPTSPARAVSVVSGQSVVLDATTGATGGPFTAVTMASSPAVTTAGSLATGTATVSGERITYAAPARFSGSTSFTYTLSNPFGTSAPITVAVTVNPMPVTAAPITVVVPADGSGSALLTADATGGPFQSAAIVSQSPAGSGTVAITQGSGPSGPTFTLTYTAAIHFSGPVTVSYTLTNAFATSAPGTVIFQVEARPDPTLDPDVRGLVIAQVDTTVRFAATQIDNFNRRLESLRNGPGRSDLDGVKLNFGDLFYRGDQSDPFALRDRQLGRQDADVAPWGIRPALPVETVGGFKAAGDGGSGGDAAGGVSVWTGGTIDLGLRRGKAGLSKLNFTTQGVSLGADFSLGDDWAIGAGTGYSSDNTKIGTDGSRSKATSYVGVFYGAYHPSDRTYLEMVFGYGEVSFESRRYVPVNGLIAYGERDGSQVFASATAAFEQRDGALTWTPYGRLTAVSAKLDAFTETGGGVGSLTFHGQDIRSLKGVAGLTSDYTTWTRHGVLTPSLRLEYAYEFEDGATYSLSYADWVDGPVFSSPTGVQARGRLTIGLGADLQRGPLRLGLEYRGGLGDDEATTNQVSAKASLKF